MSDAESDQLRGIAHEIIIKLMDADRLTALKLIRDHALAAIEKVEKKGRS